MTKKHIGLALVVVGAAATVAAIVRQLNVLPAQYQIKIPQLPTGNNYVNAAIGAGVALLGFHLKK